MVWTKASTYSFGDSQGLIRSGAPDGIDGPDVQIMTAVVPLRDFALPGPDIGEGYTIISSLMLPQTRGTVRLASATPGAATLIDPCYYGEYRDLAAIAAALHAARKIGMSEPLREWRGAEVWPGPEVAEDQFENYAPHNMRTYSHYAGTCRMGSDATAVVDPELRVHGVSGLRVADASIMPRPRVRQHQCHRLRHRRTGRRPPRSIKMTSMGSDHKRGHRAPATPRGTAFGTLPAVGGVLVGLNARHLTLRRQPAVRPTRAGDGHHQPRSGSRHPFGSAREVARAERDGSAGCRLYRHHHLGARSGSRARNGSGDVIRRPRAA